MRPWLIQRYVWIYEETPEGPARTAALDTTFNAMNDVERALTLEWRANHPGPRA
jgi:hypothetical protein